MEAIQFFKVLAALILVSAGILFVLYIFKKFNLNTVVFNKNRDMALQEVLHIDAKTKVVVVTNLDQKYILLLGSNNLVIDKFPNKIEPKFDV